MIRPAVSDHCNLRIRSLSFLMIPHQRNGFQVLEKHNSQIKLVFTQLKLKLKLKLSFAQIKLLSIPIIDC